MGESAPVTGVDIPRPAKVMYPDDHLTKQDVAAYYTKIAPVMLPHLRRRPISMQRFPDGIGAGGFYEKRVPEHFPDWIDTIEVHTGDSSSDGDTTQHQVSVDSVETLIYLAGQGCLTPHPWLSRADSLDCPDQMIFDLDPSRDDLALLRRAVRAVRDVLDDAGLASFLKTTGSRGYHVAVPLRADRPFEDVRAAARSIADRVAATDPDSFTVEMRKAKRGGRVFIDYLRNAYGQTAVAAYALRARPGAPVATPIEWDELSRVEPDQFNNASVLRRLAQRDDPWQEFDQRAQSQSLPGREESGLGDEEGSRDR
jgi:bifunctional non-homologous end joining protein LigD